MDPEAKRALDLRLARGEISEVEYERVRSRLADGVQARPASFDVPEKPLLSLDNELYLYSDHLVVAGRRKEYSDVVSVSGGSSTFTVNAMPATKRSSITIKFADGSSYYQDEERTLLGGARHKAIRDAVAMLRRATFRHRFQHAAARLAKLGEIQIGFRLSGGIIVPNIVNVMLRKDGVISDKELALDLRRCRTEGVLEIGIERANKSDPTAVYASYTKSFMELGSSRALKFNVVEDEDVSLALIKSLASAYS